MTVLNCSTYCSISGVWKITSPRQSSTINIRHYLFMSYTGSTRYYHSKSYTLFVTCTIPLCHWNASTVLTKVSFWSNTEIKTTLWIIKQWPVWSHTGVATLSDASWLIVVINYVKTLRLNLESHEFCAKEWHSWHSANTRRTGNNVLSLLCLIHTML